MPSLFRLYPAARQAGSSSPVSRTGRSVKVVISQTWRVVIHASVRSLNTSVGCEYGPWVRAFWEDGYDENVGLGVGGAVGGRGWESYKKDWGGFLDSAADVKVDVEDLGITVEGKAAFSHNLEHLVWTRKRDGSRGEMLMSVTDAYRRIDGKWLIVMEHWSIPVKDGKAVLMAKP